MLLPAPQQKQWGGRSPPDLKSVPCYNWGCNHSAAQKPHPLLPRRKSLHQKSRWWKGEGSPSAKSQRRRHTAVPHPVVQNKCNRKSLALGGVDSVPGGDARGRWGRMLPESWLHCWAHSATLWEFCATTTTFNPRVKAIQGLEPGGSTRDGFQSCMYVIGYEGK